MTRWTDGLPGALDTAKKIANGELTAQSVVRRRLDVISDLEDAVQAWVSVDAEGALEAAARVDAGHAGGPLSGVPVGIKDIFAVRDMPWRCGSPIWKDRVAGFDAGAVAMLRASGAILLGKTETTEFAGYTPTRTRNPWDKSRTPGGSSSGSAAGVACGMMPLALGTQTSGSIIRPASFCGVVGYKPSFDLIETGGVAPFARSFDTVGVFARSVPDAAFAAEVLTGLALQPDSDADPAHLSVYRSPVWDEAEPELVAAWTDFEARLGNRLTGHGFAPDLDALLGQAPALHARMMVTEASQSLAYEAATEFDLLSPALQAQVEEGRAMTAEQRALDRDALRDLRCRIEGSANRPEVWLTPSAPGPAPAFERGTGSPAFNRLWSLLGVPCCSVPILHAPDGMPMGVQVVGAPGQDRAVLTVAHWLMTRFGGD